MSDDRAFGEDDGGDEIDTGAPVEELRSLREEPSTGFLARFAGRLRRRELGSHVVTFGWTGLVTVLIEFIRMAFASVEAAPRERGGSD